MGTLATPYQTPSGRALSIDDLEQELTNAPPIQLQDQTDEQAVAIMSDGKEKGETPARLSLT